MLAVSNQDKPKLRSYAHQLITAYTHTIYADVARLSLAKLYVLNDKYAKAQAQLSYVAANSKMIALQQIARIRLARILSANKSYKEALKYLDKVDSLIYLPIATELRGDIYAAMGDYKQSLSLNLASLESMQKNGMGNLLLEMKIDALKAR